MGVFTMRLTASEVESCAEQMLLEHDRRARAFAGHQIKRMAHLGDLDQENIWKSIARQIEAINAQAAVKAATAK